YHNRMGYKANYDETSLKQNDIPQFLQHLKNICKDKELLDRIDSLASQNIKDYSILNSLIDDILKVSEPDTTQLFADMHIHIPMIKILE
ncbi:MAG: hypothetical protein ACI4S3_01710, partial [Candidatus Gastranaerophilaceae bacterium]